MKKVFLIIFCFLCFYSNIFTEELLIGGNKTVLYGFDNSAMKMVSIKKKDENDSLLSSIEIGFFIDNKPVRMIEMNCKSEYIPGTPIIKIESSYQKMKFTTYILSPMEEKSDSVYIVTDIKNGDSRNIKNIKSFFIINSKQSKSIVKYDRLKNGYIEENCLLRSIGNKFSLYFTTEKEYRELKFRKSSDSEDEKKEGEQLFFVSETGEVERYGVKRDIVEISLSKESEYRQEDDIKRDIIVDREIGIWEHWHEKYDLTKTKETELKNIKQAVVFLKLAQRDDGSIIPSLLKEYNCIKSEEMLLAALAFIRTSHFEEANKVLNYISKGNLKNSDRYIADYGYELDSNREKRVVRGDGEIYSYYIQALYLYLIAEYINESGDIAFLKREYSNKIKKQAKYLIDKINNGIMGADCYIGEVGSESADNYLYSSFFTEEGLSSLYQVCEFYLPKTEIEEYKLSSETLKKGIVDNFVSDKKIVDSLNTKEIKLRDSFVLKKGIFNDMEIRKGTFEIYKNSYRLNIKENSGREEMEENLLFAVAAILSDEKSDYKEAVERIDNIIYENGYVIPEFIKSSDKQKKYGVTGVDTKLNALYILMKKVGGENGVNK